MKSKVDIYKNISIEIEKMSPKEGDILLVKLPKDMHTDIAHQVRMALGPIEDRFDHKFKFIIMSKEMDISHLTVDEMNRLGWFRKETNGFRRCSLP